MMMALTVLEVKVINFKKVGSFELVAKHYSQDVFRKMAMINFNEINLEIML
jgi:hypothetical protein